MTAIDPRTLFPAFYANPAIATLADADRWTISGTLAADVDDLGDPKATRKAPIDVRHLLDGCNPGCRHEGPLRGAFAIDTTCLIALPELTNQIPGAANCAFYLRAVTDGLIVIDIEPGCPEDVALGLLTLPGILYSEESMSGRGYHLIAPLPRNFQDFPIAAGKRVIRHEEGWYEILIDHWVTFTRRPITTAPTPIDTPEFATVDELYASLAEKAKASANASAQIVRTEAEPPAIYDRDRIVAIMIATATDRIKTPDDFNGDMSRYEFSVLGTLYHQMLIQLVMRSALRANYSTGDQAWLLFLAARELIPHRSKHNERRNGRTYLLDRAAVMIAEKQAQSTPR